MTLRRRIYVALLSTRLVPILLQILLASMLATAPAVAQDAVRDAIGNSPEAKAVAKGVLDDLQPAVTRAEFLGRQMYLHDRAAWLATDAMLADRRMRKLKDRLGGWVTEPSALGLRVIFFSNDDTPRRLYEIDVDESERLSDAVLESPEPLSPDHFAQLRARAQAQQQSYMACARQYNTVVLPAADGIDVYMMPGFAKDDLYPLGGYHLYRFDSSGEKLLSTRKFTNGCIDLDESIAVPKAADDGFRPIGMMFSHLLDPQPTEVHVFVSLYAKNAFAVTTTGNHLLWRVDHGRVSLIDSLVPTETADKPSAASTPPSGAP